MKELIIVCKSCAARLKVTKPSSLGKMLACPKCGTMLEIKPAKPKKQQKLEADLNEKPSEDTSEGTAASSGQPLKTVLTETDFDEIDSLLEKQKLQPDPLLKKVISTETGGQSSLEKSGLDFSNIEPKKLVPKERFRSPPPAKTPIHSKPVDSAPLLPDDKWVSPQTHQRKKKILVASLMLGGFLAFVAILAAWYSLGQSPRPMAQANGEQQEQQPEELPVELPEEREEGIDSVAVDDEELAPANELEINRMEQELDAVDLEAAERPGEKVDSAPPVNDDAPPPIENDVVTFGTRERNDENRMPTERRVNTDSDSPTAAEEAEEEAAKLAELLESSGFSMTTFRDIASRHREDQIQGIPKYHFEPNITQLPDLNRTLEFPLPRLKYQQVKLPVVINDLINITGIPMTIEPVSIMAKHGFVDLDITCEVGDATIGEALDQLLATVGLVKLPMERGSILIAAEGFDTFLMRDFPLPKFPFQDDAEREAAKQDFIVGAKSLIFPQSWNLPTDPARIWLEDDSLKVFNAPVAQYQLQQLITKINAAFALAADPLDLDAIVTLRTRTDMIADRLKRPVGLNHQVGQTLPSLLREIEQKSGVTILVDWESLSQLGWSHQTKVPGTIIEKTFKEALREIGNALGSTYVVIDDRTIILTSFETAAQHADLEVYHFGQILAGKLNENQALELLYRGISNELLQPEVRIIYEPKYRSLIVVAPQSIQRKIAEILVALAEI